MSLLRWLPVLVTWWCSTLTATASSQPAISDDTAYRSWSEKQCQQIGESMRANGRVGGFFDTRIVSTERSYNYKLRATWLTPDVVRASARLKQLELGLTELETAALVEEAESLGDTIVLVEIDPREGSGVIPRDWLAFLRPKSANEDALGVRGVLRPELRSVKALSGTKNRDYAYDVFWLSFSLSREGGEPLLPEDAREAELVVRIHGKEGRVNWPIPVSIRTRSSQVASRR